MKPTAAACVLRHIEQACIPWRWPLPAALVRRVLAHLDSQGVLVRDERLDSPPPVRPQG